MEHRGIFLKESAINTIGQEGVFFNFLGSLVRAGLSLTKYVLTLLAKSLLIPLGLMAAASAIGASIQKKIYGSGMTILIISNTHKNS